jgi:hypothetical protein
MDLIPHTKMCMEDTEFMYTLLCLLSKNIDLMVRNKGLNYFSKSGYIYYVES